MGWLRVVDRGRRLFGKRDELGFARHHCKPALSPIGLCLLDALARAGDEIPPDMARSVQRLAAKEQHSSLFDGPDTDRDAWGQDEHSSRLELVAGDRYPALGDVDGPLFIPGWSLEPDACAELSIGVKRF